MKAKNLVLSLFLSLVLFAFSNSSLHAANFSFGAGADFGMISTSAQTFQKIGQLKPNLFFAVGDFSYAGSGSESNWCKFVKDNINIGAGKPAGDIYGETFPFELISGNHEAYGADGLAENFASCLPDRLGVTTAPSGRYGFGDYYLDYPPSSPNTRFIAVNPGMYFSAGTWTYTKGSARYNWLSQTIDAARAKGIKWVVVMNHMNFLTIATKTGETGADFFNLMIDKKVDLLIQGHDHTYQRSKQLAFNGTTCTDASSFQNKVATNSNCIVDDGSDNNYIHGKGMVLVIAGTGGGGQYALNLSDPRINYFVKYMGSNSNTTYGYVKVDVTDQSLNVNFIRSSGGTFSDSFSITDTGVVVTPQPTPSPTPVSTPRPTTTLIPTITPRPTITPVPTSLPPGSICQKMFIPSYFYPGSLWTQVIQQSPKVKMMIANPGSGPGTSINAAYQTYIKSAQNSGIKVLGYVYTSYGTRSITTVKAEIDKFKSWYGITDIFVGQSASTSSNIAYFQELTSYIKQNQGFVVLDSGAIPSEDIVKLADSVVVFSGQYTSYKTTIFPSWIHNYPSSKFIHLVYQTPSTSLTEAMSLAKSRNAGYLYITDDILPNPWDTLPTYFSSEIANLGCSVASSPLPTPIKTPSPAPTIFRTPTPTPVRPTPTSIANPQLKVEYYPDSVSRNINWEQIEPNINIVNTSNISVPLTELKLRYYFTRDTLNQNLVFNCWYTELSSGCGGVQGRIVYMSNPTSTADTYLELSFASGTLAANDDSGEILIGVRKTDWSMFNQGNDYSFNSSFFDQTEWSKVVLYRNGIVVWGIPPQ